MRCNPAVRECKSEEEITAWLRRKYVIVVTNNERFEPTVFTGERVVRESLFTWHAIKSATREQLVNHIQVSRLVLHDNKWIQFGEYTEEEEDIFTIAHHIETRPYELYNTEQALVHTSVIYEQDLNLYVTER